MPVKAWSLLERECEIVAAVNVRFLVPGAQAGRLPMEDGGTVIVDAHTAAGANFRATLRVQARRRPGRPCSYEAPLPAPREDRNATTTMCSGSPPRGRVAEASGSFRMPLSQMELENLVLKVSRPRQVVRRIDSPETELVRRFGNGALRMRRFRPASATSTATRTRRRAQAEGAAHHACARPQAPQPKNVPWEFLYDEPASSRSRRGRPSCATSTSRGRGSRCR